MLRIDHMIMLLNTVRIFNILAGQKEALNAAYPYDIMYYSSQYGREDKIQLAQELIEAYADIEKRLFWRIYESGERLEASAKTVPLIAGIAAAVMASLCPLYYTAAYLIPKRAVVQEQE